MPLTLITGPARSGKSEWAEALAEQSGQGVTYVATAHRDQSDAEWEARLAQHRSRRPAHWQTLEAPPDLAHILITATATDCFLIDSLGTWLVNYLELAEAAWESEAARLLASVARSPAHIFMVAEETGWGVVPAYPLGRLFRDRLGSLTRQMGAIAHPVYLVTGGHVLNLSQLGTPLAPSTATQPSIHPDPPKATEQDPDRKA